MSGTLSYQEFIKQATEFVELANKFGDEWTIDTVNTNPEYGTYLRYNQKLQLSNGNLLNIEYHVVYSTSYQVPLLFFRGYHSDGTIISLEDSWKVFGKNFTFNDDSNRDSSKTQDLYSILTQMDHPILFKPFLSLHPCRTSEILSNTPNSRNIIVTFLSLMGPYVKLKISDSFGRYFN